MSISFSYMKSLSNITLKQLYYFDRLCEATSFSAAAKTVHISQPALSLQIKSLEETFGGQLVERNRKSISLTPLGKRVQERAILILQQMNKLDALTVHENDTPVGPIRLGLIPTVAPYILPKIFPALKEGFSNLEIAIREGRTSRLYKELMNDRIDIAIIALPTDKQYIRTFPLFEEPFIVATGPGFKPPKTETLTGKHLVGHNVLLLEEGHCLRDQTIQACGINMNTALNQFGASSLATIVEMVANGFGITLLPRMALEKEASDKRIKLFSIRNSGKNGKPISRELGLAWRASSPYSKLFEQMGSVIKKSAQE